MKKPHERMIFAKEEVLASNIVENKAFEHSRPISSNPISQRTRVNDTTREPVVTSKRTSPRSMSTVDIYRNAVQPIMNQLLKSNGFKQSKQARDDRHEAVQSQHVLSGKELYDLIDPNNIDANGGHLLLAD